MSNIQKYKFGIVFTIFITAMTLVTEAWSTEYVISSTNFECPLTLRELKTIGDVTFPTGTTTGTYAHCVGNGDSNGNSILIIPRVWIDSVSDVTINVKYRTNRNGGLHYGSWVCIFIDNVFWSGAYIPCSTNSEWTTGSVTFTPPSGAKEMQIQLRLQGDFNPDHYIDWDDIVVSGTAKVRTTGIVASATYYVSPDGDDSNAGTSSAPFKTLQGALEMLRGVKAQGLYTQPTTVILKDGTYRINKPIVFVHGDGGTETCPLTIQAETTGNATISGGKSITGWTNDGNGIWYADAGNDVRTGKLYFRQMFVDGRRAIRARSPNEGFLHTTGLIQQAGYITGQADGFYYDGNDVTTDMVTNSDSLVIHYQSWLTSQHRFNGIDTTNKNVTLEPQIKNALARSRYIIENAPECLDSQGEWYLNRQTGIVKYIPLSNEDMLTASVIVPVTPSLIQIQGDPENGQYVEYLNFEGIKFTDMDWMPEGHSIKNYQARIPTGFATPDIVLESGAISAIGLRNSSITDCEITRTGAHAIVLLGGCSDNLIQKCHMYDLGGGGVYMLMENPYTGSWIPRGAFDYVERNTVDNCFIHDITKVFNGSVGIFAGPCAAYNQITHNEISYGDYTGISVGWGWTANKNAGYYMNDNIVEYNHIHHMMNYLLSDGGGIYLLGWQNAAHVCYNWIHNIFPYIVGSKGKGIYPDMGASGVLYQGNIIHDVDIGFGGSGGHESTVIDNIIALCNRSGVIGGDYWWHQQVQYNSNPIVFERNIIALNRNMILNTGYEPTGNGSLDTSNNIYWNDADGSAEIDGTYARCLPNGGGLSMISLPVITLAPGDTITVETKYHTNLKGKEHYGPWVCMFIDNDHISAYSIFCTPNDSWRKSKMELVVPPGNGQMRLQLRLQGVSSGYVDWDEITVTGSSGVVYTTNFRSGFGSSTTTGNVSLLSDNITLDIPSFSSSLQSFVPFADWITYGFDTGSVMTKPSFVNVSGRDFSLNSNSPALLGGFIETDLNNVGLYGDASWKNLPASIQHDPIVPVEGPGEFIWTYEDETVGAAPVHSGYLAGMDEFAYVEVVSDSSGKHLKIVDNPYIYSEVGLTDGSISYNMDIKLPSNTPSAMNLDFRDYFDQGTSYFTSGPHIYISPSRVMSAYGMTNLTLPADKWININIEFNLGNDNEKTYTMTVTPEGESSTVINNLPFKSTDFKFLTHLYIVGSGDGEFLIDNINLSAD